MKEKLVNFLGRKDDGRARLAELYGEFGVLEALETVHALEKEGRVKVLRERGQVEIVQELAKPS